MLVLLSNENIEKGCYIYNNIDKIKEKLYDYLISNDGCYEVLLEHSNINLYIYENYIEIQKVDMCKHIVYKFKQYPCVYFDKNNELILLKDSDKIYAKDDAEFIEYFCIKICNNEENFNVNIDVDSIPSLEGKLLEIQEVFVLPDFSSSNFDVLQKFHYGYNDLENDDDLSGSYSDSCIEYVSDTDDVSFCD
jgi:hypothetical protein